MDGLWTCYNTSTKKAYVGHCHWDGDESKMEITVPDTYEDYKITSLGGVTSSKPLVFGPEYPRELNGKVSGCSYFELPEEANSENTVELTVTVHIGKYIENLYDRQWRYVEYTSEEDYNDRIFYVFNYYYICSEENKTFYSKDGVLYLKSNDEKAKFVVGGDQ
ncbi:MAG: hypothetical protein K2O62_02595 [Clostridia bacterium]|nr:hypothetical protein [Clostridia bacterium]